MNVKTKSLDALVAEYKSDLEEFGGIIRHKNKSGVITEFMRARLGKSVELIHSSQDEFGCTWMPWMIEVGNG